MKAAYIGILDPGTTSRMRADVLQRLTPGWDWCGVDTAAPFRRAGRLGRSAAFRWKVGGALRHVNEAVLSQMAGKRFDLIWIDKGVFLWPSTVALLKSISARMVHFTPDTAFHANRSRHFNKTLGIYDLLVTTKSFEIENYLRFAPRENLHLTTQGYDGELHFPRGRNEDRRKEALFVGLCEPDRECCVDALLSRGIPVRLGGKNWQRFLRRWEGCPHLSFEGEGVFGAAYAQLLSKSWVGLGLLSKRFPELHTTRTFEIPACGAVLATEANAETQSFFNPSEAVFFENHAALAISLEMLLQDDHRLAALSSAGHLRVKSDGRDYGKILGEILKKLGILPASTTGTMGTMKRERSEL